MKAIIVDDNKNARIALYSDLDDYCPQIEIIGEAEGIEDAFELVQKTDPELVFLDIRMGDGTGFDFLEKFKPLSSIKFKVIFTTAYDEFAVKAFKYSAVDYLLKPIEPEALEEAVKRVFRLKKSQNNNQLDLLLQQMSKPTKQKLSLPEADRTHVVSIEDIIRCESDKNYTTFHMTDRRKITVSKSIKEYETILDSNDFLRVHHSHLVNLNQVKEVVKVQGPYLLMTDDSNVPVSVRKKDILYTKMKEMW